MSSILGENGNPYHGQHTSLTIQFGVQPGLVQKQTKQQRQQKQKLAKIKTTHE